MPAPDYAYLLGVYLGDGHLVACRRDVYRLSIACDAAYPGLIELAFIRGLMHSDGSRFVARQRVGTKVYEYVRYAFANRSDDIKAILCTHLDMLDIGWTRPNEMLIAIDRRREVAKLDAFVGPKS
jgi:hypothetical protein